MLNIQFLNLFRMKKCIMAILGLFVTVAVQATELPESVDFSALEQIETVVAQEGLDMEALQAHHQSLASSVEWAPESTVSFVAKEMPLVSGFWWGCCLGIVGLALVYFITDNDKAEVKNALIGCVVSTLIFGIGGLIDPFGWF